MPPLASAFFPLPAAGAPGFARTAGRRNRLGSVCPFAETFAAAPRLNAGATWLQRPGARRPVNGFEILKTVSVFGVFLAGGRPRLSPVPPDFSAMLNRPRLFLVFAGVLAGYPWPAPAQDAPLPAAAAPAMAAPVPAADNVPLTLQECVQRALQNGFDVEIQRYIPAIARDSVDLARGSFIPTLSLTGSQSHANSGPIAGVLGTKSDSRSSQPRGHGTPPDRDHRQRHHGSQPRREQSALARQPLQSGLHLGSHCFGLPAAPPRRRHGHHHGDPQPRPDRPAARQL